jgi:hypothetical protein
MDVSECLSRTDQPRDLYELLYAKRFDPDVAALRKTISRASREVLPYQGHVDHKKAQQAMRLLTDLGAADTVLSSETKLLEHNCAVAESLLDDYLDQYQLLVDDVNHAEFGRWLVDSANVHPDAAATVVQVWLKESLPEPASSAPKTKKSAKSRPRPAAPRRKRARRRRLDELFNDIGVSTRAKPSGRRGATRSRPATGRAGGSKGKTPRPVWMIPAIAGAGLVLLIVILKIAFPGDHSGSVTFTVSPEEAVVEVAYEGAEVSATGAQRTVTIKDARGIEEPIQIGVTHAGYVSGGFRWKPEAGQSSTLDQPVALPRDPNAENGSGK